MENIEMGGRGAKSRTNTGTENKPAGESVPPAVNPKTAAFDSNVDRIVDDVRRGKMDPDEARERVITLAERAGAAVSYDRAQAALLRVDDAV